MKNLRLKAARAAKDLSQQELADAVNVSRQTEPLQGSCKKKRKMIQL